MRRRFADLHRSLRPLGSRSALSNRVALGFFPVAFASQVLADTAKNGGPLGAWALTGLAGFGALVVGLALARRFLARDVQPGVGRVIAVFAAIGTARSLTVGLIAVSLGLMQELDLAYRLAGGIVYAPVLLGVVAYAVSRHDAHAALVAELEARRTALVVAERELAADRDRAEDRLVGAVRASIDPALQALDAALGETAAGKPASGALAALEHLIDGEVRPLSHRLASEVSDPSPSLEVSPAATGARVPLPARFPVARGIRPLIAGLLFAAAATPSALRDLDPVGVVVYLGALLVVVAVVIGGTRRLVRSAILPTPLAVTVVVVIHATVGFATLPLLQAVGIVTPTGIQLTGTVITALVGAMTVATPLVDAGRSATEAQLTLTVERLQRSIERARRRRWLAQRRLAHLLHGNLQGTLYAAAMQLSETAEPSPATIDAIRARIREAIGRLDPDGPALHRGGLRATVEEIVATWAERRAIVVSIDPAAEEALATDADAEEAVALVVREAVVNAIRHGRASGVEVEVCAVAPGAGVAPERVEVTVRDDGVGWAGERLAGLGTSLFDELCHEWGHAVEGERTSFRGRLVLG